MTKPSESYVEMAKEWCIRHLGALMTPVQVATLAQLLAQAREEGRQESDAARIAMALPCKQPDQCDSACKCCQLRFRAMEKA